MIKNLLNSRKSLGKAGLFGGFVNKYGGNVAIFDDHWTAKHHKSERTWLIEDLQDLAAEKSVRVTLLRYAFPRTKKTFIPYPLTDRSVVTFIWPRWANSIPIRILIFPKIWIIGTCRILSPPRSPTSRRQSWYQTCSIDGTKCTMWIQTPTKI